MPGGLVFDATQSYVAFSVVKLVGYSLAGLYFNHQYSKRGFHFLLVGITRTLLGIVLGITVGFIGFWTLQLAFMIFLMGLIPIRYLEWWITLKFFYDRNLEDKIKLNKNIALGIIWSFILDIPAIFGFLATSGLWIC